MPTSAGLNLKICLREKGASLKVHFHRFENLPMSVVNEPATVDKELWT